MSYFRWFLLLTIGAAAAASAQMFQHGAPRSDILGSSHLLQQVAGAIKAGQQNADKLAAQDSPGVIVNRSGASSAAKKLAATYPANTRAQVELMFAMMLGRYGQVEQKLGMPANELGGAVALLLVTSLQAYQGRDTRMEQFKLVAAQMRGLLSANPAIVRAPDAEKQEVYEQLAILGMYLDGVHEALQKTPNAQAAANLKQAARGYLEQFLNADADRVGLTPQGLVIKDAHAGQATTAGAGAEAADAQRQSSVTAAETTEDDAAAPAAGGAHRIEAVVLKQNWTMGIGGSLVLRYDPRVLFSDGSYTRDPDNALAPNAKPSGRWRKDGANYVLSDASGKEEKIPAKLRTRPARAKQSLAGRYSSMSALGGGTTGTAMVAAWRDYYFSADGTVRVDRGAGAATNDQTGAPEGTSVVTHSKASSSGRYSLERYTITLTFEDGKSEQRLFYLFPDSENTIGVGAGTYLKKK